MGGTRFMVQWEEHPSHLATRLGQLLEHQTLVDVTLMCNTHTLRVHRAVLAACSPYFESILQRQLGMHPLIVLKDMQFSVLKSLIEFMYCGETSVTEDNLGALLQAAKFFQVKGLSAMTKEALGLVPSPKAAVNGDAARKAFVGRSKRVGVQQSFMTSAMKSLSTPQAASSGDVQSNVAKPGFQTVSKAVAARPDTQQQTDTAQLLLSLSGSEFPKQTFHTVSKNVRFHHNISGSAVAVEPSRTLETNVMKKDLMERVPVLTPNGGMKPSTSVTRQGGELTGETPVKEGTRENVPVLAPVSQYITEGPRRRGRPLKRQMNLVFQEKVLTDADMALHKEAEASRKALEMLRQEMSTDTFDVTPSSASSTSKSLPPGSTVADQLRKFPLKQAVSSSMKMQTTPVSIQTSTVSNPRTVTQTQAVANLKKTSIISNTNILYKTVGNTILDSNSKRNIGQAVTVPTPTSTSIPTPVAVLDSADTNVVFKVEEPAEIPEQVYQIADDAVAVPKEENVEYQVSEDASESAVELNSNTNIIYQMADTGNSTPGSVMSQYMEVLKEAGLPTDVPILLDSGDGSYVTVNEEVLMNIVNGGVLQCHVTEGNIVTGEGVEYIVQEITEDEMEVGQAAEQDSETEKPENIDKTVDAVSGEQTTMETSEEIAQDEGVDMGSSDPLEFEQKVFPLHIEQEEFQSKSEQERFKPEADQEDFQQQTETFQPQGNQEDFHPQANQEDFHPQGNQEDFQPQGDQEDFQPQGDQEGFHPQGDQEDFQTQGDQEDFQTQSEPEVFQQQSEQEVFQSQAEQEEFQPHGEQEDFQTQSETEVFQLQTEQKDFHSKDESEVFQTCVEENIEPQVEENFKSKVVQENSESHVEQEDVSSHIEEKIEPEVFQPVDRQLVTQCMGLPCLDGGDDEAEVISPIQSSTNAPDTITETNPEENQETLAPKEETEEIEGQVEDYYTSKDEILNMAKDEPMDVTEGEPMDTAESNTLNMTESGNMDIAEGGSMDMTKSGTVDMTEGEAMEVMEGESATADSDITVTVKQSDMCSNEEIITGDRYGESAMEGFPVVEREIGKPSQKVHHSVFSAGRCNVDSGFIFPKESLSSEDAPKDDKVHTIKVVKSERKVLRGGNNEMSVEQALQAMMGEGSDTEMEVCTSSVSVETSKHCPIIIERTVVPKPSIDQRSPDEATEDLRLVLSPEDDSAKLIGKAPLGEESLNSFTLVPSPESSAKGESAEDRLSCSTSSQNVCQTVTSEKPRDPALDITEDESSADVERRGVAEESTLKTGKNSDEGVYVVTEQTEAVSITGVNLNIQDSLSGNEETSLPLLNELEAHKDEATSDMDDLLQESNAVDSSELVDSFPVGNTKNGGDVIEGQDSLESTSDLSSESGEDCCSILLDQRKLKGAVISPSKDIPYAVGLLPLKTALEKLQAIPEYHPRKTRSSSTGKESGGDIPAMRVKRKASSSDGPEKKLKTGLEGEDEDCTAQLLLETEGTTIESAGDDPDVSTDVSRECLSTDSVVRGSSESSALCSVLEMGEKSTEG